ncbi:DNA-binding protein [Patescibacteria group bacterium]|nr:DNA-binding protein [Patescibacteria group bacterium]
MPTFTRLDTAPDRQTYILRFAKGENLLAGLLDFVDQNHITTADVSGIGALLEAKIGYYDLDARQYRFQTFTRPMEVLSLKGNISMLDGQLSAHLHVTLGDDQYRAIGGHLAEATVGGTIELFLTAYPVVINRKKDAETGLNLLDI